MPTSSSSHRHHRRRHSSSKRGQKRVAEEVSTETLVKFVRKHKTLAIIVGVDITAFFARYVFVHMIAPPDQQATGYYGANMLCATSGCAS